MKERDQRARPKGEGRRSSTGKERGETARPRGRGEGNGIVQPSCRGSGNGIALPINRSSSEVTITDGNTGSGSLIFHLRIKEG